MFALLFLVAMGLESPSSDFIDNDTAPPSLKRDKSEPENSDKTAKRQKLVLHSPNENGKIINNGDKCGLHQDNILKLADIVAQKEKEVQEIDMQRNALMLELRKVKSVYVDALRQNGLTNQLRGVKGDNGLHNHSSVLNNITPAEPRTYTDSSTSSPACKSCIVPVNLSSSDQNHVSGVLVSPNTVPVALTTKCTADPNVCYANSHINTSRHKSLKHKESKRPRPAHWKCENIRKITYSTSPDHVENCKKSPHIHNPYEAVHSIPYNEIRNAERLLQQDARPIQNAHHTNKQCDLPNGTGNSDVNVLNLAKVKTFTQQSDTSDNMPSISGEDSCDIPQQVTDTVANECEKIGTVGNADNGEEVASHIIIETDEHSMSNCSGNDQFNLEENEKNTNSSVCKKEKLREDDNDTDLANGHVSPVAVAPHRDAHDTPEPASLHLGVKENAALGAQSRSAKVESKDNDIHNLRSCKNETQRDNNIIAALSITSNNLDGKTYLNNNHVKDTKYCSNDNSIKNINLKNDNIDTFVKNSDFNSESVHLPVSVMENSTTLASTPMTYVQPVHSANYDITSKTMAPLSGLSVVETVESVSSQSDLKQTEQSLLSDISSDMLSQTEDGSIEFHCDILQEAVRQTGIVEEDAHDKVEYTPIIHIPDTVPMTTHSISIEQQPCVTTTPNVYTHAGHQTNLPFQAQHQPDVPMLVPTTASTSTHATRIYQHTNNQAPSSWSNSNRHDIIDIPVCSVPVNNSSSNEVFTAAPRVSHNVVRSSSYPAVTAQSGVSKTMQMISNIQTKTVDCVPLSKMPYIPQNNGIAVGQSGYANSRIQLSPEIQSQSQVDLYRNTNMTLQHQPCPVSTRPNDMSSSVPVCKAENAHLTHLSLPTAQFSPNQILSSANNSSRLPYPTSHIPAHMAAPRPTSLGLPQHRLQASMVDINSNPQMMVYNPQNPMEMFHQRPIFNQSCPENLGNNTWQNANTTRSPVSAVRQPIPQQPSLHHKTSSHNRISTITSVPYGHPIHQSNNISNESTKPAPYPVNMTESQRPSFHNPVPANMYPGQVLPNQPPVNSCSQPGSAGSTPSPNQHPYLNLNPSNHVPSQRFHLPAGQLSSNQRSSSSYHTHQGYPHMMHPGNQYSSDRVPRTNQFCNNMPNVMSCKTQTAMIRHNTVSTSITCAVPLSLKQQK